MPTPDTVRDELKKVFDPEIPVNIVDLGLVYDIDLQGSNCKVRMTLTSQACPEARSIPEVVKRRISDMDGVEEVDVEIVWDPAWTPHLISAEGRQILGMDEVPLPAED